MPLIVLVTLLWIFSRSNLPFLRQGDWYGTVCKVRQLTVLYSDPVFPAFLSTLFPNITNILFSPFDCCWAPTWYFQRAIYQTLKRSLLSSRGHFRGHYRKCEVRTVVSPCVSLYIYLSWVPPPILLPSFIKTFWDSWRLAIASTILNNFISSVNFVAQYSNSSQGHPWIWWTGEDPAQTSAKPHW